MLACLTINIRFDQPNVNFSLVLTSSALSKLILSVCVSLNRALLEPYQSLTRAITEQVKTNRQAARSQRPLRVKILMFLMFGVQQDIHGGPIFFLRLSRSIFRTLGVQKRKKKTKQRQQRDTERGNQHYTLLAEGLIHQQRVNQCMRPSATCV